MAQQIVQSNHATYIMASKYADPTIIPSIVLIGVPHKEALESIMIRLNDNGIKYEPFVEPDFDMGLSAVATVPLVGKQRELLQNYNIWKERNNQD